MKTKEEIIQALRGSKIVMINTGNPRNAEYIQHAINYIESMPKIHEELSTLNPMKIDEERMNDISMSLYEERISPMSDMKRMIDQYNSTCKDHQVLQPLPSEMPELFGGSIDKRFYITDTVTMDDLYQEIRNHYGTPTKKELVSVEELSNELGKLNVDLSDEGDFIKDIAQHIIDTYSLNPPKRDEWYEKAIPNVTEYVCDNTVHVFTDYYIETHGRRVWIQSNALGHLLSDCTPYHEPSIHDKFMASLSDEQKKMYEEIKEATK